ncbi:hypothetical protein GQ457_03G005480 [Hibiscus cannabinus]
MASPRSLLLAIWVTLFVVDALIILSQAGFCVGYLIFIANTLTNLFNGQVSMTSSLSLGMSSYTAKSLYVWGCFPFQLGLNAVPTLTHLAPLSIFADVWILGRWQWLDEHFGSAWSLHQLIFYLPVDDDPVYEIVERRFWGGRYCLWLRWLLVLIVTLVSLFVPNFADFLSLVGSSVCCARGLYCPLCLFHAGVQGRAGVERMDRGCWNRDLGPCPWSFGTWSSLVEIFAVRCRGKVSQRL